MRFGYHGPSGYGYRRWHWCGRRFFTFRIARHSLRLFRSYSLWRSKRSLPSRSTLRKDSWRGRGFLGTRSSGVTAYGGRVAMTGLTRSRHAMGWRGGWTRGRSERLSGSTSFGSFGYGNSSYDSSAGGSPRGSFYSSYSFTSWRGGSRSYKNAPYGLAFFRFGSNSSASSL